MPQGGRGGDGWGGLGLLLPAFTGYERQQRYKDEGPAM